MSRRRNVTRSSTATVCGWCQQDNTRDGAYACDDCIDEFVRCLRDLLPSSSDRPEVMLGHVGWCEWPRPVELIPSLWEDLTSHVAGERGVDYRTLGGSGGLDVDDTDLEPGERRGSVPTGIVLPERATKVKDELVRALRALVLVANEAHLAAGGRDKDRPLRSSKLVPAMAEWLLWRVEAISLHPEAADLALGVCQAVGRAWWVIDRPEARQDLGDCPVDDCNGRLSAIAGATFAYCDAERHAVEAQPLRDRLIAELDDQLLDAAEIARISVFLGLRRDRDAVRRLINVWAHRGRITKYAPSATADNPTPGPRFRFGEVNALLADLRIEADHLNDSKGA